jgi:nicotinamide-nucleotide adenylyltransferase
MSSVNVMIHGRYQPFHLGHAEILGTALELSERVCVGITNPDLGSWVSHNASPHRHLPESNPFTYVERLQMVCATAYAMTGNVQKVLVVPFPLDRANVWTSYIPSKTVHLVPVYSDWEAAKVGKLRSAGYDVNVIDRRGETKLSASTVRQLLSVGGSWEELVPEPVAALVQQFIEDKSLNERLQKTPKENHADDREW